MNEAKPYPIDFDALEKGQVIPSAALEDILGVPASDRRYSLAMLGLKTVIEREMAQRGCPVTVAAKQDDLHILTDEEAVDYNQRAFEVARRSLARSHVRLLQVDRGNLSPDALRRHEDRALFQGMQLTALRDARRKYLATAHKSTTPQLRQGP